LIVAFLLVFFFSHAFLVTPPKRNADEIVVVPATPTITNNALERYNRQFNDSLFAKKPSLIESVQVVEKESRDHAEDLRHVRTNRGRENLHDDRTIPAIDPDYYTFKANIMAV
jgi:hypothetical protein